MSSESNQNREYEHGGDIDNVTEFEYVYEEESVDNGTYLYEEDFNNLHANKQESIDECTYVYDEESKKSSTTVASTNKQKPGHQRGPAGLYDEIDYNLDSHIQDAPRIQNNENVPKDKKKTGGNSKKKKIIICCVIGSFLIGAITVGNVLALPDQLTCKDEMPPNWMPKARYQLGVLCESITCKAADDEFCSLKFSEPPLSNCVNGTYGQVKDFCKQSCENCGCTIEGSTGDGTAQGTCNNDFVCHADGSCKFEGESASSIAENTIHTTLPTSESTPVAREKCNGKEGTYIGCYVDDEKRDLSLGPKEYGYKQETCNTACQAYSYFALQDKGWCVCGNNYATKANYNLMPDSECGGIHGLGGPWRNSIYATCTGTEGCVDTDFRQENNILSQGWETNCNNLNEGKYDYCETDDRWYGWAAGSTGSSPVGTINMTFSRSGKADLSFENCYPYGSVKVLLNDKVISEGLPRQRETVGFEFIFGDKLTIAEYDAIWKLYSLRLCYGAN